MYLVDVQCTEPVAIGYFGDAVAALVNGHVAAIARQDGVIVQRLVLQEAAQNLLCIQRLRGASI